MEKKKQSEWSFGTIIMCLVAPVFFAYSSLYLGLLTGNTICASIPAAVISAIILRRMGVLAHNNVQTSASAGEALAGGVLFTMPALVISGAMDILPWYLVSGVALFGGVLGVIFMIRIRRPLIVDRHKDLTYPEGTACARMLQYLKKRTGSIMSLVTFGIVGAVVKLLNGVVGLFPETAGLFSRSGVLGGKEVPVFTVASEISLAIAGVGVIIGFNSSMLFLVGGVTNMLAQPIYCSLYPDVAMTGGELKLAMRFMGVGCMVVAASYSLITIFYDLVKSHGRGQQGGARSAILVGNTNKDMGRWSQLAIFVMCVTGVFLLYLKFSGSVALSASSTVAIVIAGGFFALVASYTVGQLGSTSNPVSGMTISGLLFSCLILGFFKDQLLADINQAKVILLVIAGVVCCIACSAGAISQDLKTGYLLGATPRNQQWIMLLGTFVSAMFLPLLLSMFAQSNGFGEVTEVHPHAMPAPQAVLMATIVGAFLTWLQGGELLNQGMLEIGVVMGFVLVAGALFIKYLKKHGRKVGFSLSPMAVAVGIYLGIGISLPIAIGGVFALLIKRKVSSRVEELPAQPEDSDELSLKMTWRRVYSTVVETNYTMPVAGLIAGEALVGFIISIGRISGLYLPLIDQAPKNSSNAGSLIQISRANWDTFTSYSSWTAFLVMIPILFALYWYVRKESCRSRQDLYIEARQPE